MQINNNKMIEWADILYKEIIADENTPWYHPLSAPGHFDTARMKFINRNLNYFSFENIATHAAEVDPEFNKELPKFREFCNYMRKINGETGPFGRMCVWKIPPNTAILRHWDNWQYHRHITRYIFCISDQSTDAEILINDKPIQVSKGLYFNFYPATEYHSFTNNSDNNWYFLGYDYWKLDMLATALLSIDIDAVTNNPARYADFGKKVQKYMSAD